MLLALLESIRSGTVDAGALRDQTAADRRRLLASGELPALVEAVAGKPGESPDEQAMNLLAALLDEARMDAENGGGFGRPFIEALEHAVTPRLDALSSDATMALVLCYGRADVEVPAQLGARQIAQIEAEIGGAEPAPGDLEKALQSILREARGDSYVMAESLREGTAGLPVEARANLAYVVARMPDPFAATLAAYWLLDRAEPMRQGAALALLHEAREGRCDGTIVRRLPILRSWMPPGPARATLDDLGREIRRRGFAPTTLPLAEPPESASMSLVDGSGSQSIVIDIGPKVIATVLIKEGQGVKDGGVMRYRNKKTADEVYSAFNALDPVDVDIPVVETAIAAALADGLANGVPPSPGLIDVVEAIGATGVRPHALAARDWIAVADPEGEVAKLPARDRNRLVRQSEGWREDYEVTDSWFEDAADLDERLGGLEDPRAREVAVWSHLERRREVWATRFLRTAHVLGLNDGGRSMVATAAAMLDGAKLEEIPIMQSIAEDTLLERARGEVRAGGIDVFGLLLESDTGDDPEVWLDGFLAAVLTAAEPPDPNHWLIIGIVSRIAYALEPEDLPEVTGTILDRLEAVAESFADPEGLPGRLPADDPVDWARGFNAAVVELGKEWRGKSLKKPDRAMLELLRSIERGNSPAPGALDELGPWLADRAARQGARNKRAR